MLIKSNNSNDELTDIVSKECGYEGEISFDPKKPDGMLRTCMYVSFINSLGWKAKINLKEGINKTINIV